MSSWSSPRDPWPSAAVQPGFPFPVEGFWSRSSGSGGAVHAPTRTITEYVISSSLCQMCFASYFSGVESLLFLWFVSAFEYSLHGEVKDVCCIVFFSFGIVPWALCISVSEPFSIVGLSIKFFCRWLIEKYTSPFNQTLWTWDLMPVWTWCYLQFSCDPGTWCYLVTCCCRSTLFIKSLSIISTWYCHTCVGHVNLFFPWSCSMYGWISKQLEI